MSGSGPTELDLALSYMNRPGACPEEIRARIATLRVPLDEGVTSRVASNWRRGVDEGGGGGGRRHFGGGAGGGGEHGTCDGRYAQRSGYYGGGSCGRGGYHGGGGRGGGAAPSWGRGPVAHGGAGAAPPPRFGNRSRKEATVEERMMDRIRDKLNKFSDMTYDTTKAWLGQLLDSGETDFLTDFITLVFEKAAAEPPYCALYAQLLTELRAGFPHLGVELNRIFDQFLTVFDGARDEPAVGSEGYDAFVAQRERRKFRRGYAGFIGEVTLRGALGASEVARTCDVILTQMIAAKKEEGNQLLCEEYADCLGSLMKTCKDQLQPGSGSLVARVREAMDRADAKSLSNRARFSLMDIVDLYSRSA